MTPSKITKIARLGLGLLGSTLLLTAAPWVSADPIPAGNKPDGVRCHNDSECSSTKCVPFVADRLPLGFMGYRYKNESFCTPAAKTCPTPEESEGKNPGETFKPQMFTLVCKSDTRYVHQPKAKELGDSCSTHECVEGSCRGAGLNGTGTRVCTESGKCPKAGTPGVSPGTKNGNLVCTSSGTWKLADGVMCLPKGKTLSSPACASGRCTPSYDGKKYYCLGKGMTCSLPGKPGARAGQSYKGKVCTKNGWKRKRSSSRRR